MSVPRLRIRSPLVLSLHLLLFLAALVAACSGNREDPLKGACTSDAQCPTGLKCLSGSCEADPPALGTDENQVFAAGRAEGADAVVDVRVEGDGTCTGSSCTLEQGATVTFTAPAVVGFRFAGWSGDAPCQGSAPVLVLSDVDADIMCIAHYVRRVSVSGRVAGDDGMVLATSDAPLASCGAERCEVDRGGSVTLTAPQRSGFRFAGWSGAGCDPSAGARLRVAVDTADVVCTALYVPGFSIRARAEGVDVSVLVSSSAPSAVCAPGNCQVDAGSQVTLSAPGVEGFRFRNFTGEAACISDAPELTIASADADLACVAHYVRRFRVSGLASGADPLPGLSASSLDTFGSCEGAACLVDQGGSATLFAPTVSGFRLRAWSGADCEGQTGASVSFEQIDHDIACTAEYVRGVGVSGTALGATAQVTASSATPGAVCNGSSCALDVGGSVTLSVATLAGFTFGGWTGDPGCGNSAASFTLENIDGSKTCVANFSRVRFSVGVSAAPTGGGVIASSSTSSTAVCSGSGCSVDYGADVSFVATPTTGYEFVRWSGCSTLTTPTLSLTNITANASCTASFALRQLAVTAAVQPASAGSVTTPCGAATCSVAYGAAIRLTAVESNPAYRFTGWSGCASSAGLVLDLTNVTAPRTCTASFALRSYSVTAAVASGEGSVAPCGESACGVSHGSALTLVATPQLGFRFAGWAGDCSGTSASFMLSDITGNRSCSASFARLTFALSAAVQPAGAGLITAPCNAASCAVSVDYGAQPVVSAAPAAGYYFTGWSGCASASTPSITLAPVTAAQTCTANFALQPRVTARVAPAGVAASVAPAACFNQACSVAPGGGLTLTPTLTDSNYVFNGWTGCTGTVSRTGALTLTDIRSDLTCTANYTRPSYAVTSEVLPTPASRWGSVTPCTTAAPCSVASGNNVTLTARPLDASIAFTGWSGCSTSTAATLTLTVTSALHCVANFALARPDVVSTITVTGAASVQAELVVIPVRVVVRNQGYAVASPTSKVSIDYILPTGQQFFAAFSVPGQTSTSYAWIPDGLQPGASFTLNGTATMRRQSGTVIRLQSLADSCSGDEFTEVYCRVLELNENNNTSVSGNLTLP